MRVCFVCPEYPPGPHGGIGTFTQVLARVLVARGHDVRVIGVYGDQYPVPDREVDESVRVWRLREPTGTGGWIRARISLFRQVARWARDGVIDLIEVPDYQGWAAGWPRLSVPVVARLHSSATYLASELGREVNRTTAWLERASMRRADYRCAVSAYTARRSAALFALRRPVNAVLYNAVESPPDVPTSPRERDAIVFAGTLAESKGVLSLLEAWRMVYAQRPSARLHLYGKDGTTPGGGSMRAHLDDLITRGEAPGVVVHGQVPRAQVLQAFRTARAAALPSFAESFALTPLEAMACGCPTIYTRTCSGPELIDDGESGVLVDPRNAADIAAAIRLVLDDDVLAARLGAAGQNAVRARFSLDHVTDENVRFYRSCVATFRGAARGALGHAA